MDIDVLPRVIVSFVVATSITTQFLYYLFKWLYVPLKMLFPLCGRLCFIAFHCFFVKNAAFKKDLEEDEWN